MRWSSRLPRTPSTPSWPLCSGLLRAARPGAFAYRAVNTLDSMVGHRSARYSRFGWASARADDIVNWLPARLTALLVMAVRPGSATNAWHAVRSGAHLHPSPNAGVAEAAFAGALGIRLGGESTYEGRFEHRPVLGDGRPPGIERHRTGREVEPRRQPASVSSSCIRSARAGGACRPEGRRCDGATVMERGMIDRLPAPGMHGGDGAAIARALGVDRADVLDLSLSLNPFAPDLRPVLHRRGRTSVCTARIRTTARRSARWRARSGSLQGDSF